ncbi:MAG: HAD family phosphatase [Neptuniibacter sp.]
MHQLYNYKTYIFDCDGVLLDSNSLKIKAMSEALDSERSIVSGKESAVNYFRNNFGKSRFHHVSHFCNALLEFEGNEDQVQLSILKKYSELCDSYYKRSKKTDGIDEFLNFIKGDFYIASGSEQNQLREIIDNKFDFFLTANVYGSPANKIDIVARIISKVSNFSSAVLIGDSLADLEAARFNGIDFVGYLPYSNVAKELKASCLEYDYLCIASWDEVLNWS